MFPQHVLARQVETLQFGQVPRRTGFVLNASGLELACGQEIDTNRESRVAQQQAVPARVDSPP